MLSSSATILQTPIEYLKGVGPQRGLLLRQELEIVTFGDLLHHFPYRYFDRTHILPIGAVQEGLEYVQLAGTLVNISEEGEARKRRLTATLYDDTGRIDLVWFQNINWLSKNLQTHGRYVVFGKLNFFNGQASMVHPDIEAFSAEHTTGQLQPVYATTQKLTGKGINNRSFAKLTQQLFQQLDLSEAVPEFLPQEILNTYGLIARPAAFAWIHFPTNETQQQQALRRLKFEELFLSQMRIAKIRQQHVAQAGWQFPEVGQHFNNFYRLHLPFPLTGAQKRVVKEIRQDTKTGRQMNRLLQGDVGSGKTIVAVLVMLLALDNGFQSCLMAPTEILAQQHFQGISKLLAPMGLDVALLTGSVKGKERKEILARLASGELHFVVGTHALIEDTVQFKNLGMAVIDEQHRFGVHQRAKLWQKNRLPPHVLVMTATPIPRTLAMTLYGDLDVSVIDEMPPGRQEIKTVWRTDTHRARVMSFVRSEIDKGRQIYIVYPLIEESEKLDYESLMAGYEQVKAWFPDNRYRIAMVHGRQPADERERNMQRFVQGEAHILVATTVIEVGVNVPNASVMIIESAERFGLSQMHQLRGRVGRGAEQSYCILLTGNKLSEESRMRLQTMTQPANGFVIAEKDMELRGPGDIYGTRQSGLMKFKLADISKDTDLLVQARIAAQHLLETDPLLEQPGHLSLRQELAEKLHQGNWSRIS